MGNKNSLNGEESSTRFSPSSTVDKSPRIVHFTDLHFSEAVLSNKENIIVIWLDANLDRDQNKTAEIEDLLKQKNDYVRLCTDQETCIRCINLVKDEKIVLLISGSCSDDVLSKVHNVQQLDSVFIFCMKSERYIALKSKYNKIVGIYTAQNELIEELSKTIFALTKQITAFNLFHQNNERSMRDLTKESAEYLWFQLIKDVLIKMPNMNTECSKQDIIQKCRDYYRGNKHELKNIDIFERTYQPSDAIEWYTKSSSFISRLINKALRTEDIDLLYLFRFFIIDLSVQLKNTVSSYPPPDKDTPFCIYLYRGLKLTIDELKKLEENIGNLISTNGFLSTSRNRQVALFFATNVLFEIETNIGLQGKMWYDIAQRSKVPDEEEVIFDIGATFRIESISYDSERNLKVVHLKTTENIDTASYLQGSNAEIFLGQLYYYMGNYEKSKRYLNVLLEHLKNDYHLNNISALTDFVKLKQTYDIGIQNRIDEHLLDHVSTLSVIAGAYEKNGNYEKAIETMKRALSLLEEH